MKEAGGISFGDSVKDFARKCKGKQGRARLAAAVGVLAMLLILLSELFPQNTAAGSTKNTKPVQSSTEYQAQLENRLEHLISQMSGAGKTTVMVTLETGEEAIYALDTQSGEMQSQQTHVLLEDGSALTETVCLPQVCGVAVLCEGGGDIRVAARITGKRTAGSAIQPHLCGTAQGLRPCSFYKEERFMRALSRNTRRATAVTLAAALVIAVYLNWQYARSDVPTELPDNAAMVAAEAEDVPVQAQTVLDELPTEAEAVSSANKNYGEAQLVSVASDSGAKFFEQARLKRQKAHDEAMDSIKKTMKSSSLSAEEKKEYTAQMTANLEDLNAENEIETLIKAKGFADCLCFLQSGRADLTVMTSGEPLTAAQVAQIRDVVLNKSTVTAQNITVVEVK